MSKYISTRLAAIAPYVPGEQPQEAQYIKLNTNESPFSPAPSVLAALSSDKGASLNLYPDPHTTKALKAIADYYALKPENVLLGNGSDEILAFCFQAFCDEYTPACYPDITYGFYKVFAGLYGIPSIICPLDEHLRVHIEDYIPAGGAVFLANPNAPTGLALEIDDIERIVKANAEHVVVIDEAYVDFGAKSAVTLIEKYDNLIVVQTMSKSRSLAGARIGYALSNAELIKDLNAIKFSFNPYNVNRLSLLAAEAAISDRAYFENCINEIMEVRAYASKALSKLGFEVLPAQTNFLFAKHKRISGEAYYMRLKEKGALVRHFKQPRISDYVRITIGTRDGMQRFLEITEKILEES